MRHPELTISKILKWAEPTTGVPAACQEAPRWRASSRPSVRRRRLHRPRLTVEQILAWADEHHQQTGAWPGQQSPTVVAGQDRRWFALDQERPAYLRRARRLSG
jgi:hypothetical protein